MAAPLTPIEQIVKDRLDNPIPCGVDEHRTFPLGTCNESLARDIVREVLVHIAQTKGNNV